MSKFIIGTRGSLLAKTQCTLFKNLLTEKTSQEFELKFISTQGDQQTDKPLWQMEGQNFFTKELDTALLANEVDFVVHSYKDLGSVRPEGTEIACISKRVFPEDILLIKKETLTKLNTMDNITVGTSSPRRVVNIESHLKDFIPTKDGISIKCKTLRGNVNTRIQKLIDGQYDMIVLAMAGLERLAMMPESKAVLSELIENLSFMVLPQKSFPSAASQGALAVEVNVNSPRYKEIKSVLNAGHDEASAKSIKKEREIFNNYGGGCHLAVGIHVKDYKNQTLIIERGNHKEEAVHSIKFENNQEELGKIKKFIGKDQKLIKQELIEQDLISQGNYFVTSKYCIHNLKKQPQLLYASGARTHKLLAKAGFWVNASADGLGHEQIMAYTRSELLKLFNQDQSVKVLSHNEADSPLGDVIACYTRTTNNEYQIEDMDFDTCFWGSFSHYQSYIKKFPELENKKHACGLGKTFDQFKAAGIDVIPVPSMLDI